MKNLKVLLLTSLFMVIGITTTSAKNIEYVSKNYPIEYFSSVYANTVANIVYTQSDVVSVRADGVKEMIDHLKIKVHNGELIIENNKELDHKSDSPLVIFLSSPTINSIETHGKGNCCLKGKVKTDNLNIKSAGIGKLQALELESKKVCVNYEGIGNLKLGGTTQLVEIFSSGVGNIDCENLLAKTAIVKSTKIGKINCYASESIGLFNDGIGEITYHGNPKLKNLQGRGMGKISAIK